MANLSLDDFLLQGAEISALKKQISNHRMTHALLITGDPGTGKRTLAVATAAALLCKGTGVKPCGICSSCLQCFKLEHPDLVVVEKDMPQARDARKNRTAISVDDIREIIRISSTYPFEGENRVILILNAEDMTVQAQNALLRTMEDPPENTCFILTSVHDEQLLMTIRSRCRPLKLRPWDTRYIVKVLSEQGIPSEKARLCAEASRGSIGTAVRLAADEHYWDLRSEMMTAFFGTLERSEVLQFSTQWKDRKDEAGLLLSVLEDALRTLLEFRLTGKENNGISGYSKEWVAFAEHADIKRFTVLFDCISEARKQNASNVSFQAVLERLLLIFTGEKTAWIK